MQICHTCFVNTTLSFYNYFNKDNTVATTVAPGRQHRRAGRQHTCTCLPRTHAHTDTFVHYPCSQTTASAMLYAALTMVVRPTPFKNATPELAIAASDNNEAVVKPSNRTVDIYPEGLTIDATFRRQHRPARPTTQPLRHSRYICYRCQRRRHFERYAPGDGC